MLKQIVSIGRNKLFFHVGTKLFFPIGTLCSALIKQIVLYRRIKLKLVCCRIFVTFSFSFLG